MSATRHILAAPAWPYANGPRHIGHVSGFALPCDMFARYQRMAGHKVLMVSGTDEHGTPILVQADKENATPTYKGGIGAPYNDLVGGRLDVQVITFSNAQPLIKTDKLREALGKLGTDPGGGTPAAFGTLVNGEIARWTKVIMDAGIKSTT